MWEEEVHGGVQSGVQWDERQDEPIPQQGEDIEQGEEPKEERLHAWAERESQESELRDPCLIFRHALATVPVLITAAAVPVGWEANAGLD